MTRDEALDPGRIAVRVRQLIERQLKYPGWMPTAEKTFGFIIEIPAGVDPRRGDGHRHLRNSITTAAHSILDDSTAGPVETYSGYKIASCHSVTPEGVDKITIWAFGMNLPNGLEEGLPVKETVIGVAIS